ncbi:hypothetical protein [Nostocoides sp. Soil756]|nr:hypothetical protein [Tetrasphaera sp. Soil756]
MGKHINSTFAQLDLPRADATHRRVGAMLMYLGDVRGSEGQGPPAWD